MLVVDDGDSNRRLVRLILEKAGCQVEEAVHGQEAVEKVLQDDFDIVLMDMQMPIMDGYEASAKLRELNFDRPIVALTANVLADDIRRCLDSGCTEFLAKPIDMDVLVQTLAELLGVDPHLSQPTEDQQASNEGLQLTSSDTLSHVAADSANGKMGRQEVEPVSISPMESTLPMDEPEFVEIVQEFKQALDEKLKEMREAARKNNYQELAALAHWLKGAGGTCGFQEFYEPSAELEKLAKAKKSNQYWQAINVLESLSSSIVIVDLPLQSMMTS